MDEITQMEKWIRKKVGAAGATGTVFGMSGGLDSSVVAAICVRAYDEKAFGIIMPCHSDPADERDARLVAEKFGIRTATVDLGVAYDYLKGLIPGSSRAAQSNLKPRLRMATLYYFANENNFLVVGSGNKSEIELGYFTKFGDGDADILPLAGMYKTEVVELARSIGVPEVIITKPPSAGLWEGQTDEGEMGISYEELDSILRQLEKGEEPRADRKLVEKVIAMIRASEHKRGTTPVFIPTPTTKPES